MSYIIQVIHEGIISTGGYASEIDISNKLTVDNDLIFDAFHELINKSLLSKEYYENKGHKVLGRFIKNTNSVEINPDITNDTYKHYYSISFTEIKIYEGNKYPIGSLEEIFIGGYSAMKKFTRDMKKILLKDKEIDEVVINIQRH